MLFLSQAWTFTPEVYPTDVRASATAVAYALCRAGAFSSSYIVYDGEKNSWRLPFLASVAALAALAASAVAVDTARAPIVERRDDEDPSAASGRGRPPRRLDAAAGSPRQSGGLVESHHDASDAEDAESMDGDTEANALIY